MVSVYREWVNLVMVSVYGEWVNLVMVSVYGEWVNLVMVSVYGEWVNLVVVSAWLSLNVNVMSVKLGNRFAAVSFPCGNVRCTRREPNPLVSRVSTPTPPQAGVPGPGRDSSPRRPVLSASGPAAEQLFLFD